MYVQVPGQYNVVMRMKPQKSKGEPYYDKVTKKTMPLTNDDSEDSYYTKKDNDDEIPVDPNYDVCYDEDEEKKTSDDSSTNHHSNDSMQADTNSICSNNSNKSIINEEVSSN